MKRILAAKTIDEQALSVFIEKFVRPELKERVRHEALKRQDKLQERICGEEVFDRRYERKSHDFPDTEMFWLLEHKGFFLQPWYSISQHKGHGGMLAIGRDGGKFYAESEGGKGSPHLVYAGE